MPNISFSFASHKSAENKAAYESAHKEKFTGQGEVYHTGTKDIYEEDVALYSQLWAGQYASSEEAKGDPAAAFDNAMCESRALIASAKKVQRADEKIESIGRKLSERNKIQIKLKVEFEDSLKYLRSGQYINDAVFLGVKLKKSHSEIEKLMAEFRQVAVDNCMAILLEAREAGSNIGVAHKMLKAVISKLK